MSAAKRSVVVFSSSVERSRRPRSFRPGGGAGLERLEPRLVLAGDITWFPAGAGVFEMRGLTAGPDGNLWFSDLDQVGRMTPSGVVTLFAVPAATGVHQLTAGADGNVWFTWISKTGEGVGRVSPTGQVATFAVDTSTMHGGAGAIAAGPDGNIWFGRAGYIARVTPDGVITSFATNLPATLDDPASIAVAADGQLWFAAGRELVRMTPDGAMTAFPMAGPPDSVTLATGPDGNIWFIQANALGRVAPDGTTTIVATNLDHANGITAGPDGNFWVSELNGLVARVTPEGAVTQVGAPDTSREPFTITAGPGSAIWLDDVLTGQIGRIDPASVPVADPPAPPPPAPPAPPPLSPPGYAWFGVGAPSGQTAGYIAAPTSGPPLRPLPAITLPSWFTRWSAAEQRLMNRLQHRVTAAGTQLLTARPQHLSHHVLQPLVSLAHPARLERGMNALTTAIHDLALNRIGHLLGQHRPGAHPR